MLLRFIIFALALLFPASCAKTTPEVEVICQLDSCSEPTVTIAPPNSVSIAASGGSSGTLTGDLVAANFDSGSQTFTVSAIGLNAQMNRFGTADFGNMLAMRDVGGVHNAYLGQATGSRVVLYSGGLAGSVRNLASFGRIGATDLPLIGAAQFNGDYAGFTTTRRVNGKAQLDVDFANATIGGRVTQRVFRQRPDNVVDAVNPLSTLTLEQTSLRTDGTFSGVTGGGQIVNGQILWNPATGSFTGLIGGANGTEAVGTVALTHRAPSGASFEEIGGFLATR